MDRYLRCPANCAYRVVYTALANKAMEQHLVEQHQLPEVSAAYQASLLLPILPGQAA